MSEPNRPAGTEPEEVVVRPVSVTWPDFTSVQAPLANVIVSQFVAEGFFLTLGQVVPPYNPAMTPEQLQAVDTLPASIVARVFVTPQNLEEFIGILQTNLRRWKTRYGGQPQNEDENADANHA